MHSQGDRETGYVLVVVAGTLVLLLGFAALAVDVGVMYSAHTSAQRAADAAALAGAYTFIAAPTATNPQALAETTATNTAIRNQILGATIQNAELTPPPYADVVNRRVTVHITHTISTFFAGVLGQKFATVSVVAYAEAGLKANCSDCVKPWFLPNNVLSTKGCKACSGTTYTKELIIEKDQENPTQWAQGQIATHSPFVIKPGNPANALSPGNFYAIVLPNDIPGETGGSVYRQNIASCDHINSSISCGDSYYVKPGNMIGPTAQGTSLFISFGITENKNQLGPYRDTWGTFADGIPHFIGPTTPLPPAMSGGAKITSHQMALAPIWDVCSTTCHPDCLLDPVGENCDAAGVGLPGNGSNTLVSVIGFAMIFISDITGGNDVQAYMISAAGCGSSPAPCGGSSVMGYPLRLVRMD